MTFGCGHKISGAYMVEAMIIIDSLEPRLWPEILETPTALWL